MAMRARGAVLAGVLLAGAASGSAVAREKARFITGTFSSEQGCKMLDALAKGAPRRIETVPEVLNEDGFIGWESNCTFTKVFEHDPGKIWVGLMVCAGGPSINAQNFVFYKDGEDRFEVSAAGQDEPQTYVRCNTGEGKKKP